MIFTMEMLSVLAIETQLIKLEYVEVAGFWCQQGLNILKYLMGKAQLALAVWFLW